MVFSDHVPVEQEVALKQTARDARPARHGPRLRHRRRGRARPRLRQPDPPRPGRPGRRLRHRLPAAARAARPRRGRRDPRARRRRPRPLRRGRRARPRSRRCAGSTPTTRWSSSSWCPSHPPPRSPPASRSTPPGWPRRSRPPCSDPGAPTSPRPPRPPCGGSASPRPRGRWPARPRPGRGGLLHGLFAGGTLCEEARLIAAEAGVPGSFTDFGDDDYTAGRAHPMIDPTLRLDAAAPGGGRPGHRGGAARRRPRPRRRRRPGRDPRAGRWPGSTSRSW